ncbi:MAG: alpha/beta hydrolase family esterase [Aggregatilineales bacterium]
MHLKYFLLLCMLFVSTTCVSAQENLTLEHDDENRSYHLFIPENFDAETSNGLLLVLHGAGMAGSEMQAVGGFDDLAAAHNMLVAYPDGILNGWIYLDEEQLHPADVFTNDMEFLPLLIEELVTEYELDAASVYVAGYSNGGMMALRMLCDDGGSLAGVGVIAANFSLRLVEHCMDVTPSPLAIFLGTEDTAFPWTGYAYMRDDGFFRSRFSVAQMMGFLSTLYRCDIHDDPQRVEASNSPVSVIRDSHSDCANNASVALFALVDATHQYPFLPRLQLSNGNSGTIMAALFDFWGLEPVDNTPDDTDE